MTVKTAFVQKARIDRDTKDSAEQILKELGLKTSQAIQLFMNAIVVHRGLPFPMQLPDKKG